MTKPVLLISAFLLFLQFVPAVLAADSRAEEILKQARTAVGGDEQLQKIQGIHINGQYRRMLGERQLGGEREVSILLPNKYLVEDAFSIGGHSTSIISTRGLNGDQAWNASSGGGGGMVFRVGGPGGQQASPEQMQAALRRVHQNELTRYLLAILMMPPPGFAAEYSYAGESDVDDAQAYVIDISGPDKFSARLFFDKKSHLPLLLSYRGPKPRIMTMSRQSSGSEKAEDIKKARDEAEKKLAAEAPSVPEEVDFYIRLTEHKKVGGLLLPHKLTFLTGTEVSEEFEISKYQLNPQFKSDRFEKN